MRARLDVNGGQLNNDLLIVRLKVIEYVLFKTGDQFRDEVIYFEIRECLIDSHRVELPVAHYCLDRHMLFSTLEESTDNSMDLIRWVLVPC